MWEKVKQCLEGTGGCINTFICFNLHSNINRCVIIFLKYLEYYTAISGLLCDLMTKLSLYLNSSAVAISYKRDLVQVQASRT